MNRIKEKGSKGEGGIDWMDVKKKDWKIGGYCHCHQQMFSGIKCHTVNVSGGEVS